MSKKKKDNPQSIALKNSKGIAIQMAGENLQGGGHPVKTKYKRHSRHKGNSLIE